MTPAERAELARRLRPLQRDRVQRCRCVRVSPTVQLAERADVATGECRLVVRGVQTCGSVHSCPTCAARILAVRGDEITQALNANDRACSAMVTFTLRHHDGAPLALLRKLLALAYSELKAGRAGFKLKHALAYRGDVRAAEQTVGPNGWHPHLHALWFSRLPVNADTWQQVLSERWRRCVANAYRRMQNAITDAWHASETEQERNRARRLLGSYYVSRSCTLQQAAEAALRAFRKLGPVESILPDFVHGVSCEQLRDGGDQAARYLAKLGLELASMGKEADDGHGSSWQIAAEAARGCPKAKARWFEHSAAMKGARQLTWSRHLRRKLGLLPERTDAELAEDLPGPQDTEALVGFVSAEDWDPMVRKRRQGLLAELLAAYAAGALSDLWYVQAAINAHHRQHVPRSEKPPDLRPPWWDRIGDLERARIRGYARARAMAENAAEQEAWNLWGQFVPLEALRRPSV